MSDEAETLGVTLATYEDGIREYVERTRSEVSGEYQRFIDGFLSGLPEGAEVLEIGSGTGRDAAYMAARGFRVTSTDVVEAFLEHLRAEGHDPRRFDVLNDDLGRRFDVVAALAVFHHFGAEQVDQALANTLRHLRPGGRFALSVKRGSGEAFSEAKMDRPRFFRYWQRDTLVERLEAHGFVVDDLTETSDGRWLQCVAHRPG